MKRFNDNQNDLEYKREQRNKEINDRFEQVQRNLEEKKRNRRKEKKIEIGA